MIIDQSHKDHSKLDKESKQSDYDDEVGAEDEELHTDIDSEEMQTLQEETAEETHSNDEMETNTKETL